MVSRLSSESQTTPPGFSAATFSKSRSRGDKLFRLAAITQLRHPATSTAAELMAFLANDQSRARPNGLRVGAEPRARAARARNSLRRRALGGALLGKPRLTGASPVRAQKLPPVRSRRP